MFNFLPTMPGVENTSLNNQRAVIAMHFQNLTTVIQYDITNTEEN
jgi:hypothetical protein